MEQVYFVRLKPPAPNKGFRVRTYCYKGAFFTVGNWYKLADAQFAHELSELHQSLHDDSTPFLFDVTDAEGAKDITNRERLAAARGQPVNPMREPMRRTVVATKPAPKPTKTLSTADLKRAAPAETEPEPEVDEEEELSEREILEGFDATTDEESSTVAPEIEEVGKIAADGEDEESPVPDAAPVQARGAAAPKAAKAPKTAKVAPRTRKQR